jgi:hypothetical protein
MTVPVGGPIGGASGSTNQHSNAENKDVKKSKKGFLGQLFGSKPKTPTSVVKPANPVPANGGKAVSHSPSTTVAVSSVMKAPTKKELEQQVNKAVEGYRQLDGEIQGLAVALEKEEAKKKALEEKSATEQAALAQIRSGRRLVNGAAFSGIFFGTKVVQGMMPCPQASEVAKLVGDLFDKYLTALDTFAIRSKEDMSILNMNSIIQFTKDSVSVYPNVRLDFSKFKNISENEVAKLTVYLMDAIGKREATNVKVIISAALDGDDVDALVKATKSSSNFTVELKEPATAAQFNAKMTG